MEAKDFNDLTVRDAGVGAFIEFPDQTKFKVIFSDCSKVLNANYFLIQKQLKRILKSGKEGKSTVWLKFRK